MPRPENIKQIIVLALVGIILDPNHFGVVRGPGANIFVRRIMHQSLTIPDLSLGYPGDSLERQFHTPEAPSTELGELLPRCRHVVIRPLRDRRTRGVRRDPGPAAEP